MDSDYFDRCWRLRERGLSYGLWRSLLLTTSWTSLAELEAKTDDELEAS